jgi:signal transduction histidine kinase
VFLLAIWIDPSQPSRNHAEAYAVLSFYLLGSALYLLLTWRDWSLEFRLGAIAHSVDVAVFGVMVFLTEGYTSPFFTFSVFIMLSATIKWGWRETAYTAATLILLFFLGGWAAIAWGGADLEVMRLLIRGTYLIVLSLVLIWFGINQRQMYLRSFHAFKPGAGWSPAELPIRPALEYAAKRTRAARVAFAWWDKEEPWVELVILEGGVTTQERHGPESFGDLIDPALEGCVFLFDLSHHRVALKHSDGTNALTTMPNAVDRRFLDRVGSGKGLVVPIDTDSHQGMIFAFDLPGMCIDDLSTGEHIGEEISAALRYAFAVGLSEEASAARTRLSFARDLHDSVIQLLAGTSFRLEGIKRSAEAGRDIALEATTLQQELAAEQRDLRTFINRIREGRPRASSPVLAEKMRELLDRLGKQWGVECVLVRCPENLSVAPALEHGVQQLVREGVANAVRHGKAGRISISLDSGTTGLSLIVADNGSGFPVKPAEENGALRKPWSLNERVHEMGGMLSLYSSPSGTRITISLPFDLSQQAGIRQGSLGAPVGS